MLETLTGPQLRVLGALVEKEATVPDTYPMTANGLRTACNQKNSREPVTDYDDTRIRTTLDELKAAKLVRFVHASHGARSTKFRHILDERLDLDPASLAVLSVLMLRGPQTVNELRTRTERAHAFDSNDAVVLVLDALAIRPDPLVVHLPRQIGQKETRWAHLLGGGDPVAGTEGIDVGTDMADDEISSAVLTSPAPTVGAPSDALAARLDALEARVNALEALLTDPNQEQPQP